MVGTLLNELKHDEILTGKNILELKKYINGRYSPDRHAAVFADAVSRIVDRSISDFCEKYRPAVKRNLFRNTCRTGR